ncbi:hypothetical protein GJAV_G00011550 [Gymnothorax javanicus]|nr:hypothetical protein GJAV_G00011550 [Gymnothorax javanicus]
MLQDLSLSGQRLSQLKDLEESRRRGVLQAVNDAEEQWRGVMQSAEELQRQAEAQSALLKETQEFEAQAESTRAWIGDLEQQVLSLRKRTFGTLAETEDQLQKVQVILSTRFEGESKLQDLRNGGHRLSQLKGLEESRKKGVLQAVKDAEEQWRGVMQSVEELQRQAEAQSALVREMQAFEAQAESIRTWVGAQQQRVLSLGKGSVGTLAEIEDRLQKVQALISIRGEGESKLRDLKENGHRLSQKKKVEENRRKGVLQAVKDAEKQWRGVMQSAEELCSMLEGLVERLTSCLIQKQQAQDRVEQLQHQAADVPRQFPWPGLGDRRLALEHVRSLLNRIRTLSPTLSDLQAQGKELFQLTLDPSWIDPSWGALEEYLPPLVKDLTEACGSLEEGIEIERQCAQLMEQHNAALDWLRDQVQGLGAPPSDRVGLQSTINTLKALLQTADREQKDMRELDSVKASLLLLCSPGGQASLQQEVSRMHEQRSSSEQEVRSRLRESEARLQDLEDGQRRRAQELREEAGRVRGDMQRLGQSLDYSKQPRDISHLQDQWNTLKACEGPLEELGVRVWSLQQALGSEVADEALPGDVLSDVASLVQEHSRLRTWQGESLQSCTKDAERTLRDRLQALQRWNEAACSLLPSTSASSTQALLEEGEKLRSALQGALLHDRFLKDSVGQRQMEKLGGDGAVALTDSGVHISNLTQTLQMCSEMDSVGLQAGGTPHADREEASTRQGAFVSPWPADASSPDKIQPDHEVQIEPQPGTLRKPNETALPDVPKRKVFITEEKTPRTLPATIEPTERGGNLILDTSVQQSQSQATETLQADALPFDRKEELRETGSTGTTSTAADHTLAPPPKNTQTSVMYQHGFEAQNSEESSPDRIEMGALPSKKPDGSLPCTKMMESQKHGSKGFDAKGLAFPGTSVDMEQPDNKLTSQSEKMATVFPDAEALHVEIPEPCQYETSNTQLIKSPESARLAAKLTSSEAADAMTQPPAFKEHGETISTDTVKYKHGLSSSSAPLKASQDSTIHPGDDKTVSEEGYSLVDYLRTMLKAGSQKKEEPQALQIQPEERETEKNIQDEIKPAEPPQDGATDPKQIRSSKILLSQDTQEPQRRYLVLDLPEVAEVQKVTSQKPTDFVMEIQGHVEQPKGPQEEFGERIQQEKEKNRVMPTDTAQLGQTESTRVMPADIAQLQADASPGIMTIDTAQLQERGLPTLEADGLEFETTLNGTIKSQMKDDPRHTLVQPAEQKDTETIQHETTLTKHTDQIQVEATDDRQVRSVGKISSPDSQEIQKRYLVLDLPEVAEVQAVSSLKSKNLVMEIQPDVDQPKGPQEEFDERIQQEREIDRVMPPATAQLGQTESTRVKPADIAQLEAEVSPGIMTIDTAQLQERGLGTPEANRLEFETTLKGKVKSQMKDDPHYKLIQPAEQKDAETIQDETTLTKHPVQIQAEATDNWQIRSASKLSSPDSLEIQKRFLVLDLPEVAEVQTVTSLKPKDLVMEIQGDVEQPKGPQEESGGRIQLEKEKNRVMPTDTAQLGQTESTRVMPADIAQLEREASPGVMTIDTTQTEESGLGTPEAHRLESETTLNGTVKSQKDPHYKLVQPTEQKDVETIQDETTLTKHTEQIQVEATDDRQIRSAGKLSGPDSQEIQKRYLVLDLPEVTEVQKVCDTPHDTQMEVQEYVDQLKESLAEFNVTTQLEKDESTGVIPADIALLKKEESSRIMPTDKALQDKEDESVRMMQNDAAQPEEEGHSTSEACRPISKSEMVEAPLLESTTRKDRAEPEARLAMAEQHQAGTLKDLLPDSRETAVQGNDKVKENTESIRLPLISVVQAERGLGRTAAAEPSNSSDSGNQDIVKSSQSKKESTFELPALSQSNQKVSEEEEACGAEDVMRKEELPPELTDGPTMQGTFSEIQQLVEGGPHSFVMGGRPLWESGGSMDTSSRDLETRLSHVVFRVLNCQNRPAQLDPSAMTQQVEEAEDCRQCTQEQLAAFSRMRESEGWNSGAAQRAEGRWSAALSEATTLVQAKEAQLQLVTQYHKQTLAAKAIQEKLEAELEALRAAPVESCSVKAEKLRAVLSDLEQERTVIGKLLQTHAKLSPYLSQSDGLMAFTQLEQLQGEWRDLERAAERTLHQVSVLIRESGDLLQDCQELQGRLEDLRKSLGPPQPSLEKWDSQRAGELMAISSSLAAANQRYLHLQPQTSDALFRRFQGEKEKKEIEQALLCVKEEVGRLQGQIAQQAPSSSNVTLGKIMKVMQEAFTWAKHTESDIEACKKVALLPEAVHSQIKGLKKLQSEISAKQSQLESFVEEVKELIPDLDEKDTPMVLSLLQTLEDMSKSTAGKLARALQDMELGLQTREKMSEQIADVDSWVVAHIHKDVVKDAISKGSTADLERKLRQLQGIIKEADKQAAVTEALLMRSRDIAPELTMVENCRLNEKLICLQEDIKGIINCEKSSCQELEELLQAQASSRKKLASLEISLRQMLVDLNKFRFPITRDSLCAIEPMKHMILEQKCQVDQLPHCTEEKRKELLCTIAELQNKVNSLGQKAELHERYLNCRQRIEELKEKVEAQLLMVKDESINKEERFKSGQALLVQFPFIKNMCKAAEVELQNISTDLYPSELSSERQRINQAAEAFSIWEMTVANNANILERALLSSLHYPTEQYTMLEFLKQANRDLEQPSPVALEEQTIDRELLKCAVLQRSVECRARILENLENKNESRQKLQEPKNANLVDLKRKTLSACALRMENLSRAQEMLGDYSRAVSKAVRFLQEAESRLLVPVEYAGSCPEELQHMQESLALLDEMFQSHVTQIQALVPQHSCLSSYQAEQLHSTALSQLLVRVSKLQAQAQLRMEALQKCSKKQKMFRKCLKEIGPRLKTVEASLLECIVHNAVSYNSCLDQQEKLKVLGLEVDYLVGRLQELREWCPETTCSWSREEAITSLRREWARLHRCTRYLKARAVQRGVEWRDIIKSVERATAILDQLQAELPECSREKATQEELLDALLYTEQYQDRLDCEQRSLTALELRAARLLGVPAHQELSPPIPLCQELQTMQQQYKSLKEKGMQGRQAVQSEVQERERVKEEIGGVKEWLMAAVSLLSVVEELPSTQELQEVQAQLCTQKAVLQDIMDGLRIKYSDMYTLVPVEIDGPLQEVNRSLQEVEEKVGVAVEKSGPLCRLGAKVEEIRVGLQVVLASLEKRSLSVAEAEGRQKRVWDDLDQWHSRIAALEVEVHDVAEENPEAAHILTDKLMETLQLYQHVAKQAEQRTAFLSKIHTCLQEHEEMISSSNSWLLEAHTWLTEPCTYTTAKCLDSHVNALQMVLDDSKQMRRTLQNFKLVLQEVSSVCDMTAQEEQQVQADQRVATMQQSIMGQLSQFRHAAAEVDAIESEVEKMEGNLNKYRDVLSSQDTTSPPSEEHLRDMKRMLTDIESMKRTIAEIQSCKPGLCLPEEAEESLTVFNRAEKLLQQIESVEQTISERDPTLKVAVEQLDEVGDQSVFTAEEVIVPSPTLSVIEELHESDIEVGLIEIAHLEEDVLKRAGASRLTVMESTPEQRQSWGSERTAQQELWRLPLFEEDEDDGSSSSSSSETLTFSIPEDPEEIVIGEEKTGASEVLLEQTVGGDEVVFEPHPDSSAQDIEGASLPTEANETEDPLEPVVRVRAQAFPQSMELMGFSGLAWRGQDNQPERLKTQSQDTHSAHTPAGDRPAALSLQDGSHTLCPAANATLAALNIDKQHTEQLTLSPSPDSDRLTKYALEREHRPSDTAHRQSRDSLKDIKENLPISEADTGFLDTPRKWTPPLSSHTTEIQIVGDSVLSTQAPRQHTNTPADRTEHTPLQSAEGSLRPLQLSDTPTEPAHAQCRDTAHKHTQSQDTLLQDGADSMRPAALLVSPAPLREHFMPAINRPNSWSFGWKQPAGA